MRRAFTSTLVELAREHDDIVLLTGDLGYTVLEPFQDEFPDRFFNMGVAEQNMVGVATGLAEAGYRPFVYSIVTFATMRPYEFIRNGPIMHGLPVRIVGVGAGLDYAHDGVSHYGLEDVALMRMHPGMTVVAPADGRQTQAALAATWDVPGPVYYRLGKEEDLLVPGLDGRFRPGEVEAIGSGRDVALVALGSSAVQAVEAARRLEERGWAPRVLVVASVGPTPADSLARHLAEVPLAVTVEAHYAAGGLGSIVSEVVAERGLPCRVVRTGVSDLPHGVSGSKDYMMGLSGIDAAGVADTACAAIEARLATA